MRLAVKPLQIVGETPGTLRRIGVVGVRHDGATALVSVWNCRQAMTRGGPVYSVFEML